MSVQHTTAEAAIIAKCQPITIRQNIRRKNLKAEKKGRDWLIADADLRAWLAKKKPREENADAQT